jgi:hypothetical protein
MNPGPGFLVNLTPMPGRLLAGSRDFRRDGRQGSGCSAANATSRVLGPKVASVRIVRRMRLESRRPRTRQ